MKNVKKSSLSLLMVGVLSAVPLSYANACSLVDALHWSDSQYNVAADVSSSFANADATDSTASLNFRLPASIVGLWKFTFTALGNAAPLPPDGAVLDSGYQSWHSDNTELMNSARPAATGNFCMGVWKQEGQTYVLNHFAMAWNPPGTAPEDFAGIANIRQQVRLSANGNSFNGPATLDQYAPDGTTLVVHLAGVVSATRVTINSRVAPN
jgi:hypothetical protein